MKTKIISPILSALLAIAMLVTIASFPIQGASAAGIETTNATNAYLPPGCNSSLVFNYSQSGNIRVWNHWLQFEWCYDGKSVTVVRNSNQWVDFKWQRPGTSFTYTTDKIAVGQSTDGSQIITGKAYIKSCVNVIWNLGCTNQTSILRFRLLKNGTAIRE